MRHINSPCRVDLSLSQQLIALLRYPIMVHLTSANLPCSMKMYLRAAPPHCMWSIFTHSRVGDRKYRDRVVQGFPVVDHLVFETQQTTVVTASSANTPSPARQIPIEAAIKPQGRSATHASISSWVLGSGTEVYRRLYNFGPELALERYSIFIGSVNGTSGC
jgi:hypothetical protein